MVRGIERMLLAALLAAPGCAAPGATLDLITVARKGLAMSRQAQADRHAEIVRRLQAGIAELDGAFDNDVRLVAAGQIKSPDGQPAGLTPEWVISARKGYSAARDLVAEDIRAAEQAGAADEDNLKAADEALEMASQLVVQQWSIGERLKQQLIDAQRRLVNGK